MGWIPYPSPPSAFHAICIGGVTGYCERLTVVNGHLGWGNEGVISEQANVICDDGYMLNEKITCEFFSRVRGIWSNGVTHITCVRKPAYCPSPVKTRNGTVNATGRHLGAIVTLTCPKTFKPLGPSLAVCLTALNGQGRWTADLHCTDDFDKCPRYDVEHGSLKLNTVTGKQPEANVSCYPGYVQANGETTSHCLRGASGAFDWVPRLSCIFLHNYCDWPNASNGDISVSSDNCTIGSNFTLTCERGFESTSTEGFCLAGTATKGNWSAQPRCSLMEGFCDPHPPVLHGSLPPLEINSRHMIITNLTCSPGYNASGEAVCLERSSRRGYWNSSLACIKLHRPCENVITQHGTLSGNYTNAGIGDTFTVSCDERYSAIAGVNFECLPFNSSHSVWNATATCSDVKVCPGESYRLFSPPQLAQLDYMSAQAECRRLGANLPHTHNLPCLNQFTTSMSSWTNRLWMRTAEREKAVIEASMTSSGTMELTAVKLNFVCSIKYSYACSSVSGRFYYLKDHFTLLDHAAAEKACLATGSRLPHPGKLACVQDLLRENGDAQVAWMWETMGPGNALASNNTVISDSARLRVICEQASYPDYCPFLKVANGYLTYPSGRVLGAKATVTCNESFSLLGDASVECVTASNPARRWRQNVACIVDVNYCGKPPDLSNGRQTVPSNRSRGAVVKFQCNNGYFSNSSSSTCVTGAASGSGHWEPLPMCQHYLSFCSLPNIANGHLLTPAPVARHVGSVIRLQCDSGFSVREGKVFVCKIHNATSGVWNASVQCQDDNECTTGVHNCAAQQKCHNTPGSFICCPYGFSFKAGACHEMPSYCKPATVTNGSLSNNTALPLDAAVTVTCHHGYQLPKGSASKSTCRPQSLNHGQWIPTPTCEIQPGYCMDLSVDHATLSYSSGDGRILHDRATIVCHAGFLPVGVTTATCQTGTSSAGDWSAVLECKLDPHYCTHHGAIQSGNVSRHGSRTLGTVAKVTCHDGYIATAGALLWCIATSGSKGKWNETANCERKAGYCPPLVSLTGSLTRVGGGPAGNGHSGKVGDLVRLACPPRYYPVNGPLIACVIINAATGKWNASATCKTEFKCSGNNIKLVSPLSDVVLSYQSAKAKCAEIGGIPPSLAALSCLRSYLALKQDGNEYWVGGQSARTRHENVAHDSKLRIVQVTAMLKVACEITYEYACSLTNTVLFTPSAETSLGDYLSASTVCFGLGAHLADLHEVSCVNSLLQLSGDRTNAWLRDRLSVDMAYTTNAFGKAVLVSPTTTRHRIICERSGADDVCPRMHASNATISYSRGRQDLSKASIRCLPGYTTNVTSSTCDRTEAVGWLKLLSCQAVENFCPSLKLPLNGSSLTYSNSNLTEGSIASLTCSYGYLPKYGDVVKCTASPSGAGIWNASVECEKITHYCAGFHVKNAAIPSQAARRISDTVAVDCQLGYAATNGTRIQCQQLTASMGQWSATPGCALIPTYCNSSLVVISGHLGNISGTSLGATATLVCNVGSSASGADLTYRCSSEKAKHGVWKGASRCQDIVNYCPAFKPVHGTVTHDGQRQVGTPARLNCDLGYVAKKELVLVCQKVNATHGRWSSPDVCTVNTNFCNHHGKVPNGQVIYPTGRHHGAVANFSCNPGYQATDGIWLWCTTAYWGGRIWNASARCQKISDYCQALPVANATLSSQSRDMDAAITMICNKGYVATGRLTFKCQFGNATHGRWDNNAKCLLKDGYCPALSPTHGSVKHRKDPRLLEMAVLTCDAGFIPASGHSFTCEVLSATAGRWSGQAECVPNKDYCREHGNVSNGHILYFGPRVLGSVSLLRCNHGNVPVDTARIACVRKSLAAGQWNASANCKKNTSYCPLVPIHNGRITNVDARAEQDLLKIVCDVGYSPSNGDTLICLQLNATTGIWNDTTGCKPLENFCPTLSVANGYLSFDKGRQPRSSARLTCDDGYRWNSSLIFTCDVLENGTGVWSGTPSCKLMLGYCPHVKLQYGEVAYPEYGVLSTLAHLTCPAGYSPADGSVFVCEVDSPEVGQWNTTVECRADCSSVQVANGTLTHITGRDVLQRTATLECEPGFTPVDDATVFSCMPFTATQSRFSTQPACQYILEFCPALEDSLGNFTYGRNRTLGDNAVLGCNTGYKPSSQTSPTCIFEGSRQAGSWDLATECIVNTEYCPKIFFSRGDTQYSQQRKLGSVATFKCHPGFEATTQAYCSAAQPLHGVWSTDETCEPKQDFCILNVAIEHGELEFPNNKTVLSTATLVCAAGYIVEGNDLLDCVAVDHTHGVWVSEGHCIEATETTTQNLIIALPSVAAGLFLISALALLFHGYIKRSQSKRHIGHIFSRTMMSHMDKSRHPGSMSAYSMPIRKGKKPASTTTALMGSFSEPEMLDDQYDCFPATRGRADSDNRSTASYNMFNGKGNLRALPESNGNKQAAGKAKKPLVLTDSGFIYDEGMLNDGSYDEFGNVSPRVAHSQSAMLPSEQDIAAAISYRNNVHRKSQVETSSMYESFASCVDSAHRDRAHSRGARDFNEFDSMHRDRAHSRGARDFNEFDSMHRDRTHSRGARDFNEFDSVQQNRAQSRGARDFNEFDSMHRDRTHSRGARDFNEFDSVQRNRAQSRGARDFNEFDSMHRDRAHSRGAREFSEFAIGRHPSMSTPRRSQQLSPAPRSPSPVGAGSLIHSLDSSGEREFDTVTLDSRLMPGW
ncbi:sushi, von Willebrand factor type A, EGF and pentraxin domain-containing protein 1-like [Sycon ciliatum]|uniref:sushi, von Willebrand factor type A, EGF and pentraxin domain-containing protein 1-like n=1 Tax=Sycon ciliatum TaxID=27933 RepID=UPI0031F693D0